MPDITMCNGNGCPLKDTCWRHTAKPSEFRQSYFVNPPYDKKEKKCKYYWNDEQNRIDKKRYDDHNTESTLI